MRWLTAVLACLATLASPAFPQADPVFPSDLCASLPGLSAERREQLGALVPALAQAQARDLPAATARALLGRAVDGGWSSLQLFTEDAIREDCAVFIGPEAIEAIRSSFELYLIVPLRGEDTKGKAFQAEAIVFGRGLVTVLYDRGRFRYRHPHFDETFSYEAAIRMAAPGPGRLQVEGVKGPMGLSLDELRIAGTDKVEVRVGPFTVKRPLRRITRLAGGERAQPPALKAPPGPPAAVRRSLEPGVLERWLLRR